MHTDKVSTLVVVSRLLVSIHSPSQFMYVEGIRSIAKSKKLLRKGQGVESGDVNSHSARRYEIVDPTFT